MKIEALRDQFIYGRPVKVGQIVQVGRAQGMKLVREGLAKSVDESKEPQLETKAVLRTK